MSSSSTSRLPPHRLEELIQTQRPVVKRLAEACGVDYSTVYRWRNGTLLPSDKLLTIAAFFNVTVEYLLGHDENGNGEKAA